MQGIVKASERGLIITTILQPPVVHDAVGHEYVENSERSMAADGPGCGDWYHLWSGFDKVPTQVCGIASFVFFFQQPS